MSSSIATISAHLGALVLVALTAGCRHTQDATIMSAEEEWRLIWSDEFTAPEIDPTKWEHQVFPGVDSGNRELQHYTNRPENSFIRDGRLVIHAKREDYKDHAFTSARLHTRGRFSFLYGRVEARIRIPSTVGIWPAFWMMPEQSVYGIWPRSGEIDIMESVNIADEVYGTIHFGNPTHQHTGAGYRLSPVGEPVRLFSEDFHVYTMEWDPTEIRWYVDGNHYSTLNRWVAPVPYPAPFDQEFHLLLNVAVGGNWPGPPDETSVFPQEMEVDWVRVYQRTNQRPVVRLLSPAWGERVPGEEVSFEVEASDPEGAIVRTTLELEGELLAESTTPPFTLTWKSPPDGCHNGLVVSAYDDLGQRSSLETRVIVGAGCPRKPHGEGTDLPGILELEHFDDGGLGVAYHDVSESNAGGAARPYEAVDLGPMAGGGVSLGWTEPGEWLEYTVRVQSAGVYTLVARGASATNGGKIRVSSSAAPGQSAEITIPITGDWHAFQDCEPATLELAEGEQVLRVEIIEGGFNLDRIAFQPIE